MKNRKGFTLIELVITLAILGIVVPIIFSPIIFSLNNFNSQNEKAEIISDAQAAMDYLTREIRKSKTVDVVGNTIETDRGTYKLENRKLMQGSKVISGKLDIEALTITKNAQEITIVMKIKDTKGDNQEFSSTIYVR